MANSRKSGNVFEALFVSSVLEHFQPIRFQNKSSEERFASLKKDIEDEETIGLRNKISKKIIYLLESLLEPDDIYQSITINKDSSGSGKNGDTTDICLQTKKKIKYCFSLKRNNDFIKHPRPNAFATQIGHKKKSKFEEKYKKEYNELCGAFMSKWKNEYQKFNQISQDDKMIFYKSFNLWFMKKLKRLGSRQRDTFLRFCISPPKNKEKKFMLHTCSSKIETKNLKYEIKIE